MKKIIREKLREDLKYYHVKGDVRNDEYELGEDIVVPTLSLPSEVDLTDEDKEQIKVLDYKDIDLEPQNETSPVKIKVSLPLDKDLSSGIALDIALVGDVFYQPHISLDKSLRGLGLGYKIYKALIMDFGHIYSGKGRRFNTIEIPKILEKLKNEPGITCVSNEIADLCIANNNPDKDKLLSAFGY